MSHVEPFLTTFIQASLHYMFFQPPQCIDFIKVRVDKDIFTMDIYNIKNTFTFMFSVSVTRGQNTDSCPINSCLQPPRCG